MARTCARPSCNAPATAVLTYRYETRTAWLADLTADSDPSEYDMCTDHADRLNVPRGWTREDQRSSLQPLFRSALAS